MYTKNVDTISLNSKKFNKDHKEVFNTIVGEIPPGKIADNLLASVQCPFNQQSASSRKYFLSEPGGTGQTFPIRTMQAILTAPKHIVIAVATSAVAALL